MVHELRLLRELGAWPGGGAMTQCGWCNSRGDMTGGIYGDGGWMCGY